MIRLLLADDHEVVRFGLRLLVTATEDLELVGTAADGRAAVAMARRYRPDVALVDLSMPVLDGVTAIRRIHQAQPEVRLVALTARPELATVREVLTAGACGYLVKGEPPARVLEAIRSAYAGGTPMSAAVRRMLPA